MKQEDIDYIKNRAKFMQSAWFILGLSALVFSIVTLIIVLAAVL